MLIMTFNKLSLNELNVTEIWHLFLITTKYILFQQGDTLYVGMFNAIKKII